MLRILLPLCLQYLDEFVQSELLSRRLAHLCCKKLGQLALRCGPTVKEEPYSIASVQLPPTVPVGGTPVNSLSNTNPTRTNNASVSNPVSSHSNGSNAPANPNSNNVQISGNNSINSNSTNSNNNQGNSVLTATSNSSNGNNVNSISNIQ